MKEWVDDPPPEDSWWNDDGDGDGWANGFETVYGSDPYRLDSDFDGITDRDEHDLLPLNDPWHWDSDGDGFSDYDEYYNQLQGTPLSVDYSALIASSQPFYSAYDADGDGLHNPWDGEPLGFDRDGDGILNWQDSYMDDASNGSSPPPEGPPPDSDGDGIPDDSDPYPYGSYWFNGAEYGGAWIDTDGDGVPDPADAFPNGSFTYNGTEYEGAWSDMDNDSIPDVADPFPSQGGSYWYDGVEYGGTWADADGDGVPDPADPTPNPTYGGSYTYNGVEYPGPWSDADGDGVPDPADATPNGGYWYGGTEYPGAWADSDGDNVPDPADAWPFDYWNGQPHYSYNGTEYAGEFVDRDGDFIPDPADSWPDDPENGLDSDLDGLDNYTERTVTHTLTDDVDSDNDYLTDKEEALVYHSDPNNPQSVEENQTVLDFIAVGATTDTDDDGLPDAVERVNAAVGELNPDTWLDANGDLDADGYTNLQAFMQGWDLKANLNIYDLDGDGITDVIEDYWNEIQPGILDKTVFADAVADPDGDGLLNIEEVNPPENEPYHPGNATSVGRDVPIWHVWVDGTYYWVEQAGYRIGNDYDARFEAIDIVMNPVDGSGGTDTYAHVNYEGVLPASPVNPQDVGWRQATGAGPMWVYRVTPTDFDGDGMNDVWEHRHGLKLRHLNDASIDADNDGLANVAEFQHNTHPRIADSDGDGYKDGFEVEQGTRPDERTESPLTVVLAQIAQARALADEYRNLIVNRDTLSQRAQLWEEIQALLDLINAALAELAVESSDPGSVTDAQSSADHVDSDSGEEPPSMADVESRWVNSTYQGAHHIGVERWWIWSEEFQGWSPMGDISIVVDYDQPAGGGWSDSGGGGGDNGSVMSAINSTMFAPTAVYGPVPFDGWSVDGFYQLMPASGDTDPPPPDVEGTQDGEVTLTTAAETTPQEWSGGGREFRIVRTPEGDQSVPLSVVFVKGVGGNDLAPNASTTAIEVLALGPGEVASSSTVTIGAAPSAPNTSHSESVSLLPIEFESETAKDSGVFYKLPKKLPVFGADSGINRGVQFSTVSSPAQLSLPSTFSTQTLNSFTLSGPIVGNQTLAVTETSSGSRIFRDSQSSYEIDLTSLGSSSPSAVTTLSFKVRHLGQESLVVMQRGTSSQQGTVPFSETPVATEINRTPLSPDDNHDGVIYLRLADLGNNSSVKVKSGGNEVTLNWRTVASGARELEPFILLPASGPSVSTAIKSLRIAATAMKVTFFLVVAGQQTQIAEEWVARPPFLACSLNGEINAKNHLEEIDYLIGRKGSTGMLWWKKETAPPLGWANSLVDEQLTLAEFQAEVAKHELFYLMAHGTVRDASALQDWGFVGVGLYDPATKKTDHVLTPAEVSTANAANPHYYELVFLNSCAGADQSEGTPRQYWEAFEARNYVSWDKPTLFADAATGAKRFFQQLDGGEKVKNAVNGISGGFMSPVTLTPLAIGQTNLTALKTDDESIIDQTP